MSEQILVITGGILVVALIILIQIYLSTRPSFIWGFVLPLVFLLVWLYVVLDIGNALGIDEKLDLTINQLSINYMSWLGIGGMIVSLLIFLLSRKRVAQKEDNINNRHQEALFAKQQRQAAIAAICEDNDFNRYFQAKEDQRMQSLRVEALNKSNQRLKDLEEKRHTKDRQIKQSKFLERFKKNSVSYNEINETELDKRE